MKITGVILTKRGKVTKTKDSLSFCDEIIVVKRNNITDFAEERNKSLEKAKNKWVIFLDDDEIVSQPLRHELSTINYELFSGYYIKRRDFMWGRELKYGETGSINLLRLAKKNAGLWRRKVHEYWDVSGKVGELNNPILHYPHQSVKEFIESINKFSGLHAYANYEENKKSSLIKIIFWPKFKFYYNFFVKLGFLDGIHGFIVILLMSFHSFLAWSKLWIHQNQK